MVFESNVYEKFYREIQLKVHLFTYNFIATIKHIDRLHHPGRALTSDLSTNSFTMIFKLSSVKIFCEKYD